MVALLPLPSCEYEQVPFDASTATSGTIAVKSPGLGPSQWKFCAGVPGYETTAPARSTDASGMTRRTIASTRVRSSAHSPASHGMTRS